MNARTPWWLWPNLLSLDAPLVAVVWQDFLARCYPSTLLPAGRWTLALTVWAIYLADRLIDVRHPMRNAETSRHSFYRNHSRVLRSLLMAVVCADLVVAVLWLRPAVLSNGLWVGAAVGCYLGAFAALRVGERWWKPVCAALLFTTGVFLVGWTSTRGAFEVLSKPAVALAWLVLSNLVLIEGWEKRRSTRRMPWWIFLLLAALACQNFSQWYAAVAIAAAALAALDGLGARMPQNVRHVLADTVLLVPLLL